MSNLCLYYKLKNEFNRSCHRKNQGWKRGAGGAGNTLVEKKTKRKRILESNTNESMNFDHCFLQRINIFPGENFLLIICQK